MVTTYAQQVENRMPPGPWELERNPDVNEARQMLERAISVAARCKDSEPTSEDSAIITYIRSWSCSKLRQWNDRKSRIENDRIAIFLELPKICLACSANLVRDCICVPGADEKLEFMAVSFMLECATDVIQSYIRVQSTLVGI